MFSGRRNSNHSSSASSELPASRKPSLAGERRKSVRASSDLDAVELLDKKLFFAVHESSEETMLMASVNHHLKFVSMSDLRQEMKYGMHVNHDSISSAILFQRLLQVKTSQTPHPVVLCSKPKEVSSNVFLVASYLVLQHHKCATVVAEQMSSVCRDSFIPFRDQSGLPDCGFQLTLLDCLHAIIKARAVGWCTAETFDVDECERLKSSGGGQMTAFGDAFLAFPCPGSVALPGASKPLSTSFFVNTLGAKKVRAVLRLNGTSSYDESVFLERGLFHQDLFFEHRSNPPRTLVKQFLDACDEFHELGTIGIHCKTGLGNTGTLICLWMMKNLGFSAREAIAWVRMARPGSVEGGQQLFLERCEAAGFDGNALRPFKEASQDETAVNRLHSKGVDHSLCAAGRNIVFAAPLPV